MSEARLRLPGQMRETIRREALLHPGDRVLAAVSGGADSMTMLHCLLALREELGLAEVAAAHLHHGLRGEEADRDAAFVREQCALWDVPLTVEHADVAAEAARCGEGIEEAGRRVRYAFLTRLAADRGAAAAVAHTQSDSVETLLLHLARGCGLRGLCGIPAARNLEADGQTVRLIRPLIDVTRADVEAYCTAQRIPFVTDSTNGSMEFARNRVRMQVIPALTELYSGASDAIARLTKLARRDEDYLESAARAALDESAFRDGYGGWRAERLAELPPALQSRALRLAAACVDERAARALTEEHLGRLAAVLQGGRAVVAGGLTARAAQGRITFYSTMSEACEHAAKIPLVFGQSLSFFGRLYRASVWTLEELEKRKKIHKNLLKNSCNYDKITGNLILRPRRAGDRFHPSGRGIGKSLKKLLAEGGVPAEARDAVPIVCDEQGIVLVCGFGCDERVRIDGGCRRVLVLETVDGKEWNSHESDG